MSDLIPELKIDAGGLAPPEAAPADSSAPPRDQPSTAPADTPPAADDLLPPEAKASAASPYEPMAAADMGVPEAKRPEAQPASPYTPMAAADLAPEAKRPAPAAASAYEPMAAADMGVPEAKRPAAPVVSAYEPMAAADMGSPEAKRPAAPPVSAYEPIAAADMGAPDVKRAAAPRPASPYDRPLAAADFAEAKREERPEAGAALEVKEPEAKAAAEPSGTPYGQWAQGDVLPAGPAPASPLYMLASQQPEAKAGPTPSGTPYGQWAEGSALPAAPASASPVYLLASQQPEVAAAPERKAAAPERKAAGPYNADVKATAPPVPVTPSDEVIAVPELERLEKQLGDDTPGRFATKRLMPEYRSAERGRYLQRKERGGGVQGRAPRRAVDSGGETVYVDTPEARKKYQLDFKDGEFVWGDEVFGMQRLSGVKLLQAAHAGHAHPKDVSSGGAGSVLFVMTKDGVIYAADQSREVPTELRARLHFHHSSFLAGAPVAAAGILSFKQKGGKVVLARISDASGHYQPEREKTRQVVRRLKEMGVELRGVPVYGWQFPKGGLDAEDFANGVEPAKEDEKWALDMEPESDTPSPPADAKTDSKSGPAATTSSAPSPPATTADRPRPDMQRPAS